MITVAKKRRPKSKNYFTKDTEQAIVKYNNEPNSEIRSQIYRDEICAHESALMPRHH